VTLQSKLLAARKAKDKIAVSTLSLVVGELARLPSKDYTDEQVFSSVRKLIKAITEYPGENAVKELEVLNSLLPKEASDEDLLALAKTVATIQEFMKIVPTGTDKGRASKLWKTLQ
jgi:uncharacterized protein YqeY